MYVRVNGHSSSGRGSRTRSVKQPTGCGVRRAVAHSASAGSSYSRGAGGTSQSPPSTPAPWPPVFPDTLSPSPGTNASRKTRCATRSPTCSSAPVTTNPPYDQPSNTMSRRSSYSTVLATSVTCVVRQTCGLVRCARSPMPVRLGVNTSCPAARSGPRTFRKPYEPPQAPCTRTKIAIWLNPLPFLPGILDIVTVSFLSPSLVGRADELAALDAALARTGGGEPYAVLIGGEAGVGKSRLVNEFAGRSRRAGARVLAGGCLELGADGLPFAPFTSVLRELVRDLGADGVAGLLPAGATRELARLLPEFGEPAASDDAGAARARLFEQMLILLEQLADRGPLVLIVEDAHWADRSTRDLLEFLIRNQRTIGRLLIMVTYRSDDLHRTHPLRPLLAELGRLDWVRRIELGRLTRGDHRELVARITGREPREDAASAVYRRTEGNPLFVEALIGDGGPDSGLPESLRDLLIAGVRRLPEQTQDVVRIASAGGEQVGHALLAAVADLDDTALASALRPAVAANVLLAGTDSYSFRHALIREAVHDELLPGERGGLHGRFARAIGGAPLLVPPGRAAVERAYPWYAALDPGWALISAWQAAAESGRALAHAEQLAMLSRVLELWDRVPDAADRIGADHVAVLETATGAAELAGEYDRGVALASGALKEIDPNAEPVRAALLRSSRGHLAKLAGREDYAKDLAEAVRLIPADAPPAARAQVLEVAAHDIHHREGFDPAEARARAEEAVAVARQAGDPAIEAMALVTLACAEPFAASLERNRALLAEARAAAARAKAYQPLLSAAITESDMLEGLGEHELAAAVAREGDAAAEVIERALEFMPPRVGRSSVWRLAGDVALGRGDLPAAAARAASVRAALDGVRYKDEHQLPLARL